MKRITVKTIIMLIVGMLILTGCSFQSRPENDVKPLQSLEKNDKNYDLILKKYYTQKIKWEKCDKNLASKQDCAKIKVPLNYEDPNGKTITLIAKRYKATNPIGTLFVNPGGPGGSGYNFVDYYVQALVSPEIKENYNIVGFDPRGVGKSTPLDCYSDKDLDKIRQEKKVPSIPLNSQNIMTEAEKEINDFKDKCEKKTGNLYKYMDTISAAKDLDIWRHLVNDKYLNYFGYSYGTSLGATYIGLFPNRVGRMVLDGVVDTQKTYADLNIEQAVGFEKALNAFSKYCAKSSRCPIKDKNFENISRKIVDVIDSLGDQGITAKDGRKVNSSVAFEAVASGLYSQDSYPDIESALSELIVTKQVDELQAMSDNLAGRDSSGRYDNSTEAFIAIDSSDYSKEVMNDQEIAQYNEKVLQKAPIVGKFFIGSMEQLRYWPTKNDRVKAIVKEPKHKVLIVGTSGDPATPYDMAVDASKNIRNSYLLTWNSFTHGAYGAGSKCISNVVDKYLLSGQLPEEKNKKCKW